jgi:hypothetical protein
MKYLTWRERAAPIISRVISEVGTTDMKILRSKLREAYPFGLREYYPYKTWCDEINRQLISEKVKAPKAMLADPDQITLFES